MPMTAAAMSSCMPADINAVIRLLVDVLAARRMRTVVAEIARTMSVVSAVDSSMMPVAATPSIKNDGMDATSKPR